MRTYNVRVLLCRVSPANFCPSVEIPTMDLQMLNHSYGSVKHLFLLIKLKSVGIGGKVSSWMQSYLSGSVVPPCLSGVHQRFGYWPVTGSITYINDLPATLGDSSSTSLDDVKLIFSQVGFIPIRLDLVHQVGSTNKPCDKFHRFDRCA